MSSVWMRGGRGSRLVQSPAVAPHHHRPWPRCAAHCTALHCTAYVCCTPTKAPTYRASCLLHTRRGRRRGLQLHHDHDRDHDRDHLCRSLCQPEPQLGASRRPTAHGAGFQKFHHAPSCPQRQHIPAPSVLRCTVFPSAGVTMLLEGLEQARDRRRCMAPRPTGSSHSFLAWHGRPSP